MAKPVRPLTEEEIALLQELMERKAASDAAVEEGIEFSPEGRIRSADLRENPYTGELDSSSDFQDYDMATGETGHGITRILPKFRKFQTERMRMDGMGAGPDPSYRDTLLRPIMPLSEEEFYAGIEGDAPADDPIEALAALKARAAESELE